MEEQSTIIELVDESGNNVKFDLVMTFDYEGDAGELDMEIETDFSDWNQLDDSTFQAPDNVSL